MSADVVAVSGVKSDAAVNQAKKALADRRGCDFYDLKARKFDEQDGTTLVVVMGPAENAHRLAGAEPRTQPEADND